MAAYTYYLGGANASNSHAWFQPSGISVYGSGGGPVFDAADCTIDESPANATHIRLIKNNGSFAGAVVGMYVAVVFSATYTSGNYPIIAFDDEDFSWIDIDCTWSTDVPTARAYGGGARLATRANLNSIYLSTTTDYNIPDGTATVLTWASTNKITVKIQAAAAIDCAGTAWTVGSRVGSATYWVDCIACDSNWNPLAESVQITESTGGKLATGLLIGTASVSHYMNFYGIDFNGNGPTDTTHHADYGFQGSSANHADYIVFRKCVFRNCHLSGAYSSSPGWNWFYQCKAYLNSQYGISSNTGGHICHVHGCVVHSNGYSGIRVHPATSIYPRITANYIYNNGYHGIETAAASNGCLIEGNVICKNGEKSSWSADPGYVHGSYNGINIITGFTNAVIRNNILALNSTYNIFDADSGLALNVVNNNVSVIDGTMTGHANFMASVASDAEWEADTFYNNFMKHSNLAESDPKFLDWTTMVGATNEANWNLALQPDAPSLNQITPFYSNISAASHRIDYPAAAEVIDTVKMADLPVDAAGHVHGTYHAPDAAEVISTAVFGPASGTAGTFDEAARNTDPGVANVLASAGTYKIQNVTKTPTLVPDYPDAANVLNTDTVNGAAGTFDEAARNTDPGVANVLASAGTYKIQNVTKTPTLVPDYPDAANVLNTDTVNGAAGTFDEAARNTDPGVEHVLLGEIYKILNVAKTGVLEVVGGVPEDPIAFLRRVRE